MASHAMPCVFGADQQWPRGGARPSGRKRIRKDEGNRLAPKREAFVRAPSSGGGAPGREGGAEEGQRSGAQDKEEDDPWA